MGNWKVRREQRAQRKRLGLGFLALTGIVQKLVEEERWTDDNTVNASLVLDRFIRQNSTAVKAENNKTRIDFESILEWIEKILPIILALLAIFL